MKPDTNQQRTRQDPVGQQIPCPCTECRYTPEPQHYARQTLETLCYHKQQTHIQCHASGELVSIQQLLAEMATPGSLVEQITVQPRRMQAKLLELAQHYPVLVVCGPRQAGKTTLIRHVFAEYDLVSLEDPDRREFALQDPRGFLDQYAHRVIIDEVQRAPELFSYLQTRVDASQQAAQYILSGSAQFHLVKGVTQTLAGRAALFELLPLALDELPPAQRRMPLTQRLISGGYPRVCFGHVPPTDWYPDYIRNHLERDMRELHFVRQTQLIDFRRFLKLCAAYCGQMINYERLARDCGLKSSLIKEWINGLETACILYRLPPYYKNYAKRQTKRPKLYFYDIGIVCALLDIHTATDITNGLKGSLFENWVISEFKKHYVNQHRAAPLYYWRNDTKREIDLIIAQGQTLHAIEIKSGQTIRSSFFDNLHYLRRLTGDDTQRQTMIYGGQEARRQQQTDIVPWQHLDQMMRTL